MSSAARRPTESAPVSTAASPRLDASRRGGFGATRPGDCGSRRRAGRRSRRSRRRARPGRRRRPRRSERRAARSGGLLRDDLDRHASPARAAAKISRVSYGASRIVRRPRAATRSELAQRTCTRIDVLGQADPCVVELSRCPVQATVQLAAQHEAGAETGTDRHEHEVVDAAGNSAPLLAERRQVDVVLDRHRPTEPRSELARRTCRPRARHVLGQRDVAACDCARDADDHTVDQASGARSSRASACRRAT